MIWGCKKMNRNLIWTLLFSISTLTLLAAAFDINYIVTSKNLYEKISFKEVFFNEKKNKLEFIVTPNTTKEFSLSEICYIRFKNNKNIIFSPVPRIEVTSGEIIVSTIDSVENGETIILKNPVWSFNKVRLNLFKLRKIIFSHSDRKPDTADKDFIIFENEDLDKGTITSIETNRILLDSEVYNKQKIYQIRDNKDSGYNISQIHFVEISEDKLENDIVYLVIVLGDGSKVIGKLKKVTNNSITVESVVLGTVEILTNFIHSIYTINSNCHFLSDMPIISSKTFSTTLKKIGYDDPYLFYKVKKDCSSKECKVITLAGEQFPKGLGIHSTTILKIDLDRKFKKLFSFYGIDESILSNYNPTYPGGVVSLKIYGDGKILFKKNKIKLSQKLNSFTLNVANVKILKIIVKEPPYPKYKDIFILGRFSLGLPILIR